MNLKNKSKINSKKLELNVEDTTWLYEPKYPFMISGYSTGYKLKGKIYSIRIYNRALTLKEIENNYISTMSSVTEKSKFQ